MDNMTTEPMYELESVNSLHVASPSTKIFTGVSLKGFLDFRVMGLGNNHWRRSWRMDAKAKIILELKN